MRRASQRVLTSCFLLALLGCTDDRPASPPRLEAPSSLRTTRRTPSTIELRWSGPIGASSFAVDRRAEGEQDFRRIAEVPDLGDHNGELTDTGLRARTNFVYRVRASDEHTTSDWSDTLAVRTALPSPIVTNVEMIEPRRVSVRWEYAFTTGAIEIARRERDRDWLTVGSELASSRERVDELPAGFVDPAYRARSIENADTSDWSMTVAASLADYRAILTSETPHEVALPTDTCGYFHTHSSGRYTQAIAWKGGASFPPVEGAFAERFHAVNANVCNVYLDLTRKADSPTGTIDLFVWGDAGDIPGWLLCSRTGVRVDQVAIWPAVSRLTVELAGCCSDRDFWIGFRGNWPRGEPACYVALDTASTNGSAATNIAYWSSDMGWWPLTRTFPQTGALGIGCSIAPCNELPPTR